MAASLVLRPDPPSEPVRRIDLPAAERAVAALLRALGEDTERDGLLDTPRRVAASYAELLSPPEFTLTTFPNDEHYDELVLARDIPISSLCEHHMLPFIGVAHVAYLPGDRIVGLSKLARVVEHFARGLQVQERLTRQIAETIQRLVAPHGVGVIIEARHLCMQMRGVQRRQSSTVTSCLLGAFRDDARTRAEFLALAPRGRMANEG